MLLLAAGESKRLGQSKQLLDIRGKPLVVKILDTIRSTHLEEIFVVTGAYRKEVEQLLENMPIKIVYNKNWKTGMGSSISTGIREIQLRDQHTAVLILLCDQYRLSKEYLQKMIDGINGDPNQIIVSQYNGITAVPALFKKKYFHELLSLSGENGARKIIMKHLNKATIVPFPEGSNDIDTIEDLKRFNKF